MHTDTDIDWLHRRKIARHPQGRTTPETVLASTAEKLPRIKAVAIVIQWDDDSFGVDWSSMKRSDFVYMGAVFENAIRKDVFEGVLDNSSHLPPGTNG